MRPWNGGVEHILQSRLAVDNEARPLSKISKDDRGVDDETERQLAGGVSCADMGWLKISPHLNREDVEVAQAAWSG